MHKIKQLGLYVNAAISCCCFAEEDKGLFVSACRTCSTLFFLTQLLKLFFCFVAVSVVDAEDPHCSGRLCSATALLLYGTVADKKYYGVGDQSTCSEFFIAHHPREDSACRGNDQLCDKQLPQFFRSDILH